MKRFFQVTGLLLAVACTSAGAETFPSRPIRLVVPFVAGGSADLLGRIVGQQLSEKYGQPVVIDNRPGAGGHVGAEVVANSKPDGYTLVLGTTGVHAAYSIYPKLQYDPAAALTPVTVLGEFPNVLVANPTVPVQNVKELIALARSKPNRLSFGTAGNGSSTHLAGELFKQVTSTDLQHVPYRGSAAALNDIVGGQIQLMFENLPTVLPFIQSGKVRAIGLTSKHRSDSLPNVPTIAESGVPEYEFSAWFTIAAPAGTPPDILKKLNADIHGIVNSAALAPRWKELGVRPVGGSLPQVSAFIASERTKWTRLVTTANLKAD